MPHILIVPVAILPLLNLKSNVNLYKESLKKNCRLSMATIYNTLRNFTEANLLREVSDHCVFLSATPIHLKNHDLFSLLKILIEI